tara:strand:+ start:537 stop:872 length:336 start_codon:yes stop_codon:yes gene_type:complete
MEIKLKTKDTTSWVDATNATPLFMKCDCHSEGIEVQYYREDDKDRGFYVNYWKYGIESRYSDMGIWDKLKYAWKILRTGTLHGDQVMITVDKAKEFSSYLEKYIKYDEDAK